MIYKDHYRTAHALLHLLITQLDKVREEGKLKFQKSKP